jgi:hypothetical protein
MNHLFQSILTFTIALFFLMLGIFTMMLPWSPHMRTELIQFILEDSPALFLLGLGFVGVALALIIHLILGATTHYYQLRSEPYQVWINEEVIQGHLNSYWKTLFPQSQIPNRLSVKKNKIHLMADLPFVPISEQKNILEQIKNDLAILLSKSLGYNDAFFLSASFQAEPAPIKKNK